MAEYKKLYRSRKNQWLGGVCAGISEYLEIDPLVIRILWIIFTLVYGAGILAYLILWFLVPLKPRAKKSKK